MAISLTKAQVAEKAWRLANPGMSELETKLTIPDVSAFIDEAVGALCDEIVLTPRRYLLQTVVSGLALSSGQAQLGNTIYADTLRDSLGCRVTHSSYTRPLSYAQNLADLYYPQAGGSLIAQYHVTGGSGTSGVIYARNGVPADLTGNLTISGVCASQTFETLAPELETDLVLKVADMAKAKMKAMALTMPNV